MWYRWPRSISRYFSTMCWRCVRCLASTARISPPRWPTRSRNSPSTSPSYARRWPRWSTTAVWPTVWSRSARRLWPTTTVWCPTWTLSAIISTSLSWWSTMRCGLCPNTASCSSSDDLSAESRIVLAGMVMRSLAAFVA